MVLLLGRFKMGFGSVLELEQDGRGWDGSYPVQYITNYLIGGFLFGRVLEKSVVRVLGGGRESVGRV